jgi:hypothetical protein
MNKTKKKKKSSTLTLLAGLIVFSCGSSNSSGDEKSGGPSTPSPDGGGATTGDATAAPPDAGSPNLDAAPQPKLVTYTGTIFRFDPTKDLANQSPFADAEVCVVSVTPSVCVKTNEAGKWVLRLRANDRGLRLTYTAAGYLPLYHVTFTTEEDDTNDKTYLLSDALAQSFWSKCGGGSGATYPEGTNGAVLLQGFRRTGVNAFAYLEGATMTATGGAAAAAKGPCYMATPWQYDPQPTATTLNGVGAGVFANVAMGSASSLDVNVNLSGAVCYSNQHLVDGPSANMVRAPLRPGFLTLVDVVCE